MIGFLKNFESTGRKEDDLEKYTYELEAALIKSRAWSLWWMLKTLVHIAVYYRDSIGRATTYCNVSTFDFFDMLCKAVWNVDVKIGASLKKKFPMGNVVRGFDFDITPILKDNNLKNVLGTTPAKSYYEAIESEKKGKVRFLTPEIAQKRANMGVPSIIIHPRLGKTGHLAIVCPSFRLVNNEWKLTDYRKDKGCYTSNVGWENGFMFMDDPMGFGSFLDSHTLEVKPGVNAEKVPAIIVELKDRKTGDYLV